MVSKKDFCVFELSNIQSSQTVFFQSLHLSFGTMSPKKKLLTYPDLKTYSVATNRNIWSECTVVKDQFLKATNENIHRHNHHLSNLLTLVVRILLMNIRLILGAARRAGAFSLALGQ